MEEQNPPPFLPLVQDALVVEGGVESAAATVAVNPKCRVRVRSLPAPSVNRRHP